ncbi:delta-12 fatty acid desaturas-like protein [Zopfia rhizophila CBS 207.26]|uniref:Delta-12 fatty acid desaturas-like protein n=1 Tax=Zopfia rhizophila CBS 207.26 TaxID=1314779 RepID=A0A6A6E624_9PEZI|nr:delta-12 fatty acid desaturas-like protein [Zopfia rhizophila CBS 207.26]
MSLNYSSHPSAETKSGSINKNVSIQTLRNAIPAHCFKPLYRWGLWYLFRDVALMMGVMASAYHLIPMINSSIVRFVIWILYGYLEGLIMTGIWVLGHECGHSALFPAESPNHVTGFLLHSFLLTPYFAWRSSHRRHHIYANNVAKDHTYVPPSKEEYLSRISSFKQNAKNVEDIIEDSPLYTLCRIILQQFAGWPTYLVNNITASSGSLSKAHSKKFLGTSHFRPSSSLFRPEEANLVIISDLGIGAMLALLWYAGQFVGTKSLFLLYFQPYLWLNHWIVAITYLHHTHPALPKYDDDSWSFIKGATATVDRNLGWTGKHLLHDVADYHVIHHLFPHMPFYYGEEATKAIKPILGSYYREDKSHPFIFGLWESFTQCQYVEPDDPDADPGEQTLWYKGGPSPPPVYSMRR